MEKISIIIPVFNEAGGIVPALKKLENRISGDDNCEILLIDGGSTDQTVEKIQNAGFRVLQSPEKGRAKQMNFGADHSEGRILYFLHADSLPPMGFTKNIRHAVKNGAESGCYRLAFDDPNRIMKTYAWFTRFDLLPFRFGDQSLFVTRDVFENLDGFRNDHIVMEDNEFISRLKKRKTFRIMDGEVVTSARTYRKNGFVRLQLIFTLIFCLYWIGASQQMLVELYRNLIRNGKI